MRNFLIGAVALAVASGTSAQTAPHHIEARAVYERIMGFRTAAGQGQVPAMASYLAEVLRKAGVPESDIAMLPSGETTAMLVRLAGRNPNARPILFSAHMDVVDALRADWERDPFGLVEENGNFYGRGAIDNKAGVTALISTIVRFKQDGTQPRRTLVFAFIGDEETGIGTPEGTTRKVVSHAWVSNAEFAINTDAGGGFLAPNGRPLIYLVQGAEKTYATFELTVTNPGGHSSRPRAGDNAIADLSRALLRVSEYRFPVQANALTRAYLDAVGRVTPGPGGDVLRAFAADPSNKAAADALWGNSEFVGTTRTTCVPTMVQAGHAENALPQRAIAKVNCRIFPGVPVEQIQAELVRAVADPKVKIVVTGNPEISKVSEMRPDVDAAIARSIHKYNPGVPIAPYLESGGTDGLVYRAAGIPTFATSGIFIKPDEMFAHGQNERVPVKSFYEGLEHIHDLAVELGGK